MGRIGPGLAWLLLGGFGWAQLLRFTAASPVYVLVLLAGGVAGTLLASRVLTRLFLPYDGEVRRWRRLAKAEPRLQIEAFGGQRPPEGSLERGRVSVQIRPARGQFRVLLRLREAYGDAPDIRFSGRGPAGFFDVGDARLDGALAMEGTPEAVLAALTEPVREALYALVVNKPVRVSPGRISLLCADPLRRPHRFLERVDALAALLEALDEAVRVPVDDALLRADPSPTVRAARLRAYFARGVGTEAAARALAGDPAPIRWAISEGLAVAGLPERASALRRIREALAHGDRASQRHAFAVLGRRFPVRLALAEARRQALHGEAPPLPEAVALLPREDLEGPTLRARLDVTPPDVLHEMIGVFEHRAAEGMLLHLARHAPELVALEALAVLGRIGTLETVPALLALSRTPGVSTRTVARFVARRLQARFGHPAKGALSRFVPDAQDGELSEPL